MIWLNIVLSNCCCRQVEWRGRGESERLLPPAQRVRGPGRQQQAGLRRAQPRLRLRGRVRGRGEHEAALPHLGHPQADPAAEELQDLGGATEAVPEQRLPPTAGPQLLQPPAARGRARGAQLQPPAVSEVRRGPPLQPSSWPASQQGDRSCWYQKLIYFKPSIYIYKRNNHCSVRSVSPSFVVSHSTSYIKIHKILEKM